MRFWCVLGEVRSADSHPNILCTLAQKSGIPNTNFGQECKTETNVTQMAEVAPDLKTNVLQIQKTLQGQLFSLLTGWISFISRHVAQTFSWPC